MIAVISPIKDNPSPNESLPNTVAEGVEAPGFQEGDWKKYQSSPRGNPLLVSQSSSPALQASVISLQTERTSGIVSMRGTVNISGAASKPTVQEFKTAIFDAEGYPLTATYMRVPALTECRSLGTQDGYAIVYQRTGGIRGVMNPRHYVIAMKTKSETESQIEIEWWLVEHTQNDDKSFTGPYADTLNAHQSDHVYVPYNHGGWIYDWTAGTITYYLDSDSGGNLPSWAVSKKAIMAFPQELLKVKWGIEGKLE